MAQTNKYDDQGRPHGIWENYYRDGTSGWRCNFHHGKRKGLGKYWFLRGSPHGKHYDLVIK